MLPWPLDLVFFSNTSIIPGDVSRAVTWFQALILEIKLNGAVINSAVFNIFLCGFYNIGDIFPEDAFSGCFYPRNP